LWVSWLSKTATGAMALMYFDIVLCKLIVKEEAQDSTSGMAALMVPSSNAAFPDLQLYKLDDMLEEYDMKRDSVEINHRAPQWSHNAV